MRSTWARLSSNILRCFGVHRAWAALLGGVALVLALQSLHVFVESDDILWLERAVSDAGRPWQLFRGEPLFGNYYRPITHAVWLLNYRLWGFEFRGYQATLIFMWFAGAWWLSRAARAAAGPLAGHIAFAFFAFHVVYLCLLRWKSWFTTVTECFFLLAFVWMLMEGGRLSRGKVALLFLLGLAAILAKEPAAAIVPAILLGYFFIPKLQQRRLSRGETVWLAALLAGGAAVCLALPAYRKGVAALFSGSVPSAEVSLRYVPARFHNHAEGMLKGGVNPYLLLYLLLWEGFALLGLPGKLGARTSRLFLGVFIILAAFIGSPAPQWIWEALLLGGAFVLGVFGGGKKGMCALWFAAGMGPALLSRYRAGAYHIEAYAGFSLYVAILLSGTIRVFFIPVWEWWRRRSSPPHDWAARSSMAIVLFLLLGLQIWTLCRNANFYLRLIREQTAKGSREKRMVQECMDAALARKSERGEIVAYSGYEEDLVALILRERHGISVRRPFREGVAVVPLDRLHPVLAVYGRGLRVSSEELTRANLLPRDYVERFKRALDTATGSEGTGWMVHVPAVHLMPGKRYAFGAFIQVRGDFGRVRAAMVQHEDSGGCSAEKHRWVTPSLSSDMAGRYAPGWLLCAETMEVSVEGKTFRLIPAEVSNLQKGSIAVRDPFVVELEALQRGD